MQADLPELIEDLYQTIADPTKWISVLINVARNLNTDLLAITVHAKSSDRARCFQVVSNGKIRATAEQIETLVASLAPFAARVTRNTIAGEFIYKESLANLSKHFPPRAPLKKWLNDAGAALLEHAWVIDHAGNRVTMTLVSNPGKSGHDADAGALAQAAKRSMAVRILAPHLARCLRVGIDCSTSNAAREYGVLATRNANYGVFLINASGKLGLVNPYGNDISNGNGLRRVNNHIEATDEECNVELQSLIKTALAGRLRSAVAIRINRQAGEFPLVLTISALPELDKLALDPPVAVLMVTDPTLTVPRDTVPLQKVFKLTRAEAGVARSIMAGKSIEECAEENGHSVATSRNLLKRAFNKTGTHRQNELSALLQSALLKLDVQRLSQR